MINDNGVMGSDDVSGCDLAVAATVRTWVTSVAAAAI